MQGILKFKLPDEQTEFDNACQAGAIMAVLWEHDQALRAKLKYENLSPETDHILEELRQNLWDECKAHGVNLNA